MFSPSIDLLNVSSIPAGFSSFRLSLPPINHCRNGWTKCISPGSRRIFGFDVDGARKNGKRVDGVTVSIVPFRVPRRDFPRVLAQSRGVPLRIRDSEERERHAR